jgi:hypothetical protein
MEVEESSPAVNGDGSVQRSAVVSEVSDVASRRVPKISCEEYRLDDGLRVMFAPNPHSSVVAVDLTCDAGPCFPAKWPTRADARDCSLRSE